MTTTTQVRIRPARREDGAPMWQLVRDSGVLDENSPYHYVLMAEEFGDTSVVAERDGRLVGFVTGLRPPRRPGTVFVWQVGVAASERGRGLASRLLDALLDLPACAGARALEATVTPGNGPSRALFTSFARRHGAAVRVDAGHFPAGLFPGGDHEPEDLFRIEPIRSDAGSPVTRSR